MKQTRHEILRIFGIAALIVALLAGCSSGGTSGSDSTGTGASSPTAESGASQGEAPQATDNDTQYPIVIKHALGEAVIEKKPERIATIQWANHDIVLALGVVPVGFSAANYGVQDDSGLLPWTKKRLEELGVTNPNVFQDTDGLDFEAIADTEPDVILAAYSGITQEEYDILAQIAPTVAYQKAPWVITWREQVLVNAKGMGMEAEGEQLIRDTEKLIADKASAYPKLKGAKVAFVPFSPNDLSTFYIYMPTDPRAAFLIEELGMEYPQSVLDAAEDPDSFYLLVSAENSDILHDADILVSYGDENLLKALQADPLLGKIPAVEKGAVVLIGDNTPLAAAGNPNPLSISYTIDEYLQLIGGALDKVK
jgi:iron complex transport system substrate-binding protein